MSCQCGCSSAQERCLPSLGSGVSCRTPDIRHMVAFHMGDPIACSATLAKSCLHLQTLEYDNMLRWHNISHASLAAPGQCRLSQSECIFTQYAFAPHRQICLQHLGRVWCVRLKVLSKIMLRSPHVL